MINVWHRVIYNPLTRWIVNSNIHTLSGHSEFAIRILSQTEGRVFVVSFLTCIFSIILINVSKKILPRNKSLSLEPEQSRQQNNPITNSFLISPLGVFVYFLLLENEEKKLFFGATVVKK